MSLSSTERRMVRVGVRRMIVESVISNASAKV
jgi:hypothetical protein